MFEYSFDKTTFRKMAIDLPKAKFYCRSAAEMALIPVKGLRRVPAICCNPKKRKNRPLKKSAYF